MANTRTRKANSSQSTKSTPKSESLSEDTAVATKKPKAKVVDIPDFSSKNQWIFELTGIKPAIFKISNDDLRSLNEDSGRYEAIRFCENEDSIWVSEQPEKVKKGFIVFNDGTLEVSPTESTKLEFLFRHPEYNKSFRLLDRERDATAKLKDQEVLMEALNKAMKTPFKELRIVALAKGIDSASEAVCRTAMIDFARNNPSAFLDAFDNDLIRISAKVREAINLGIIDNDGKHLRWTDNGKRIMTLVAGVDPIEYAATRLVDVTDENKALLAELDRKMS